MRKVRNNLPVLLLTICIIITAIITNVYAVPKEQQAASQKVIKSLQANVKQLDIYQGEKNNLLKKIKITAVYSDGTKKDITGQVAFSCKNASQVSLDGNVVQGISPGSATLMINFGKLKSSVRLSIKAVPVVLIPGTMGSNLVDADTNRKLWLSISQSDMEKLILPENGELPASGQAGSNIRPTTILDDGSGIPQLDFYSSFETSLKLAGYKVEAFPYDWRLDVDRNADRLGELLKTLAKKYNTDKFSVVAHSQGGLIAKRYLQRSIKPIPGMKNVNPGKVKIGKLILAGVPQYGTPIAFNSWFTGKVAALDSPLMASLISYDTLKRVINNSPAVYEMFPSKKYFSSYAENGINADRFSTESSDSKIKDNYKTMAEWIGEGKSFNKQLYNKFISLYEGKNGLNSLDLFSANTSKYADVYIIAGFGFNTAATIDKGKFYYLTGDGTVPLLSATAGKLKGEKIKYVKNANHGALLKDRRVINEISNILSEKASDAAGILKSPGELRKSR
ncbi:MAG TPA: hypothetical protein VHT34_04115 [Clostridia bacterium]|nr:hypothetical protein [Clostridia bacterium]